MLKRLFIGIIILIGILHQGLGQKLAENKVDDFTGNSIKRTSWETLNMTMTFTAYFRISRINDNFFFDLKMITGSVFSIGKGQKLMFKLSDGEIIELQNFKYAISCIGCGAKGISGSGVQGIRVLYPISSENIKKLKNNLAVKIRVYTNDGYLEIKIKSTKFRKVQKALSLVE